MATAVIKSAGLFACWLLYGATSFAQISRDVFDDTIIHEINIDIDPNDWATLKERYLYDDYYHAVVTTDGVQSGDIGIRSRGRGSRSPEKPNLDINVDKFIKKQKYFGLGFLVLKANNQDASLLHEIVTFKLFKRMGLPAPRESFAKLSINGEYYGVYTIVEHVDEDYLQRNFGEDSGDLFEWQPNMSYYFQYLGSDPALYSPFLLEPKTNEDDPDVQKFIDMVLAINTSSDADFVNAVSPYLDLKLYLTQAATENAVAELDGIWADTYGTNNIFLYRFKKQTLFQFLTWDKDLTFLEPKRTILESSAQNVLARRALAIPEYRQVYMSSLQKAVNIIRDDNWMQQEITRLYQLVHDVAVNDPHKQCILDGGAIGTCGPRDFEAGIQEMRTYLAERIPLIESALSRENTQTPPQNPVIDSVTVAAPNGDQAAVPGSVVKISGARLAEESMTNTDKELPRVSGKLFVAVDGVRAPIASASPNEIVVQIPWDIPLGTVPVAVVYQGGISNTAIVPVLGLAPAILAVVHADGTLVTESSPADRGENIAVYATGLGAVDQDLETGRGAPNDSLVHTRDLPALDIGSASAQVLFSGLTPGSIGLYQINLQVPNEAPGGPATALNIRTGNVTVSSIVAIR